MLADNEPYDQLLDGEPLVEIFPDLDGLADRGMPVNAIQDAPAFLLPPDRLWTLGLRAGDLVGFRTRSATAGAPGSYSTEMFFGAETTTS